MPKIEQNSAPAYRSIVIHSVITFAGQSLMQIVDLLFCRDLGSKASSTIGTATALFSWFIILGLGLISSLEYLIPNSLGANDHRRANEYFYAGVLVVILTSFVSTLGLNALSLLGPLYGMNSEIVGPVQSFCFLTSLSYIPVLLIPLFRVELQARGYPNDATFAYLYGNILNVILNWMFVLGHLGVPRMGLMGSAYATVIARYALFLFLLYRILRVRSKNELHLKIKTIPFKERAREIIHRGFPSALHMLFEIGAFIVVGMLASRLSPAESAAHAIALSIASFAFMVPAGMSSAAALTISRALGEGNQTLAKALGHKTIKLGLMYASFGSLFFFFGRHFLASSYTKDPETLVVGTTLLLVAGIFQFGDVLQVILAGCIRGFGQTRVQAQMNAIGHWAIGIPLGFLLTFHFGFGIAGLWIGLCVGLFSVSGLLYIRYRKIVHT